MIAALFIPGPCGHTMLLMTLAENHSLHWFAQIMSRARSRLIEYILPSQCLVCTAMTDHNGALCPKCWRELDFIEPPFCSTLGIPFEFDPGEEMLSAQAITNPPKFNRARAAVRYQGAARGLIQALKYRDRMDMAPHIARWMVRAGAEFIAQADLIIPVPLHRMRLWQRRYNQSAVLARAIGEASGLDVDGQILQRIRPTRSQVGLTLAQRRKNVSGAFSVDQNKAKIFKDAHIILIDDVITTGATVNACADCLLSAGVAHVDVLAFGMVVDPQSMAI